MANLFDVINNLENLRHLQPASQSDVETAERRLGITFASDYKQYTQKYGAIIAKGLELTGLNVPVRLNVVDVTLNERKRENIPSSYYVIENLNIESILILQNGEGQIAEYCDGKIKNIANSLIEYITEKQK